MHWSRKGREVGGEKKRGNGGATVRLWFCYYFWPSGMHWSRKGREVRGGERRGEERGKCRERGGWREIGATVVSGGACNLVITVTNPGPPMVVDNRII